MEFHAFSVSLALTLVAGLSTVLGSIIFLTHIFRRRTFMGYFLGFSAGVMIYLSFIDLLPFAMKHIGFISTNLYFFLGIIVMGIIDLVFPFHFFAGKLGRGRSEYDTKLLSTGFIVTLGLIIHNIPEGVAVFISSFTDFKLGALLAVAIALHNIPEGIAISAPLYHATREKGRVLAYSFIAGMAEPFGAIIAYFMLRPYFNETVVSYVFSLVAGIMVYISFDELLPACFREGQSHRTILGIVSGMAIVAVSLSIGNGV